MIYMQKMMTVLGGIFQYMIITNKKFWGYTKMELVSLNIKIITSHKFNYYTKEE